MEEELCRGEARKEAVRYESLRVWDNTIAREVGEGTSLESVWGSLSVDSLLPHTGYHLRRWMLE